MKFKRVASALLSAVTGAAMMSAARTEVVQRREQCLAYKQFALAPRHITCLSEALSPYDF